MPRFRNEAPEQSQYSDGDVVWVKIHNTEIWWPGEVTSTQDFRFVNSARPPFAVVAFFNEKTFEHVRSAKLIYPFQCEHKEEFIKRGKKKAEGIHMADKFSDDVLIAESRFGRAHHSSTSSVAEATIVPTARPDSLIKACLSSNSNSNSNSSGVQNSNARGSGVPSAAGRQEPTFRIMDIGGGATPPPRDRAFECNVCSFHTNSMSVLLIHRRNHLESSSSFSSFSSSSTTNTATSTGNKKFVSLYDPVPKTRASRRAHTTTVHDVNGRRSRDNGVRCSSRHVSIVIDAPLTSEEQEKVKSIVDQTLASIELVVGPKAGSSAGSTSASASNRKSSSSSSQVPAAESTRRSNANSRDPRSQRTNKLRATMPAPQSPPTKQRRLTRSMSRRQQGASPVAVSPEILPPPVHGNSRRSARRRCTLAAAASEPVNPPRRGNLLRKTMTTAPPPTVEKSPRSTGRRKQPFSRTRTPVTDDAHISPSLLISPSIKRAAGDKNEAEKQTTESDLPITLSPESMSSMVDLAQPNQNLQISQSSIDASKQLQLSLMAEWGDDETDESDESMEVPPQPLESDARIVEWTEAVKQYAREQEEEQEQEKTEGVAAKKRIRNIPKKDRRDVVVQEFHVQDSQPEAEDPEVDEPIIIQDSDASSNGSVVFVEDEPRQRGRGVYPQSNGNANANANDKATSSLKVSNIPSCFDFEEEDDVQQQEGPNGLSYRRRTNTNRPDINGKGHADEDICARNEEPVAERELDDNVSNDYLFKGFEDVPEPTNEEGLRTLEEAPCESDVEPEPLQQASEDAFEPEEAVPEDVPEGEAGDHMGLPIKERQKRIFKSRNKSTMACSQDEDLLPASMTSTLPNADEEEEVTAPRTYSPPQEANCVSTLLSNGEKNRRLSAHNSNTNSSEGVLGDSMRRKRRYKSKTESSHRPSQRSKPMIRQQTPSPEHEELSNHSNSSSSHSSSNSNLMSSSSSSLHSHGIGTLSPEPSSSNSCSIASNIAVISAEEARELQRSASGAGLSHAAIVDATQPVQRGGVLILEDIRLPNLYEPSSLQSSDSNGSRQTNSRPPNEDNEQSQDTADQPETNDEDQEESQDVEQTLDAVEPMDQEAEEDMQLEKEHEPDLKPEEKPEPEADNDLDPWSPIRDVRFLPQSREVLLKKREQELLRQYEADLVSGRSAEKCRQARARWSRTMTSPEEADVQESSDMEGTPLAASPSEEQQQREGDEEHEAGTEGEQPVLDADEEADDDTGFQMAMDMDIELEAVEFVMPASLFQTSRRPASHPQVTPLASTQSAIGLNRTSRHLSCARALSDADVAKAHQQLVDLREQQRLRFTPPSPPVVLTPPATLLQASTQRRQRRRSKNSPSDHVESSSRSEGGEESSSDAKDGQESPENPPQLCAGRICAVMTRPIPGYSHTFMLCSLNNNNFTPLNNVALYLDNEKNHLVPVPREALLEPPRLADGHPLSAVFADIDFLGGEAVAQVVEPSEMEMETELELDQDQMSPRQLSPQMLLSEADNDNDNENDVEAVDAMGIMTPLSQVAEGGAMPAGSYVNEEEELSLQQQLHANILQLNVNGYHLQLDPSMLFSMAEQPDTCIEVNVSDAGSSTSAVGGSMTAVLQARDILQAAEVYLQERDLQLVNVEDMTLDDAEADASSADLAVPGTDLLSQALAGSQVVDDSDFVNAANAGVGLLHIDTRTGAGLLHVGNDEPGSVVFISHPMPPQTVHLTPPITARTNETNALLDQTPIMSTLENPSGMQLRRVSPLVEGNLEDSLAVIGVTNGSGVPTSLELPITVTNPAIASRMGAPVADMLQFAPFQ
ncbi:uncharacterized protein LOC6550349 isoform X2 [Drosophila erecta]|uniref:PWWP domain-containing protein n=1 Tax=Drosophila erecta TaxID=7220 RepID=B3NVP0_DROER|nr:uncharacterized protein LOC6550349 isoform X2 [Drosophila erecta]EDV46705.2 uncharacterized protein Dere_GG19229 [Drosophila erecta]